MNMPGLLKIKQNKSIKLFLTINIQFSVLDDDKSNKKRACTLTVKYPISTNNNTINTD